MSGLLAYWCLSYRLYSMLWQLLVQIQVIHANLLAKYLKNKILFFGCDKHTVSDMGHLTNTLKVLCDIHIVPT